MDEAKISQEKIARYIDGTLTEQERTAFEIQLAEDEGLQQAVANEKWVQEAMWRLREQELREKMQQWKGSKPPESKPGDSVFMRGNGTWLLLFFATLAIIGLYLFNLIGKPSIESRIKPQTPTSLTADSIPFKSVPEPDTSHLYQVGVPIKTDQQGTERKTISAHALPATPNTSYRITEINQLAMAVEESARSKFINSPSTGSRQAGQLQIDSLPKEARLKIAGKKALEQKKYLQALQQFQQLDQVDDDVRYWTAEALFGNRQYEEAAEIFRTFRQHDKLGLDASKNLVLCYRAQYPKRQDEFRKELQALKDSKSPGLRKWADYILPDEKG